MGHRSYSIVEADSDLALHPLQIGRELDLRAEPRGLRGAVTDDETHAARDVRDLVKGLADRVDVDPLQVERGGGWRVAPDRDRSEVEAPSAPATSAKIARSG